MGKHNGNNHEFLAWSSLKPVMTMMDIMRFVSVLMLCTLNSGLGFENFVCETIEKKTC